MINVIDCIKKRTRLVVVYFFLVFVRVGMKWRWEGGAGGEGEMKVAFADTRNTKLFLFFPNQSLQQQ